MIWMIGLAFGLSLAALVNPPAWLRYGLVGGSLLILGLAAANLAYPGRPVNLTFLPLPHSPWVLSLSAASAPANWMAVATALVNVMAQVYATAYLAGDRRQIAFQAVLLGFTGAMLVTVWATTLLTQFAGWEWMGLGSYLLVGHHATRPDARLAAAKAMMVTRIGDVFFLTAVIAGQVNHTSTIGALNAGGSPWIAWALVVAVATKSAQLPFSSWLLDAMAGPVPASALIHAATMVAAGPYLLIRYYPLLLHTPGLLPVLAGLGGATAIVGAVGAVGAVRVKRTLAYSTVSQLGIMLFAIGIKSPNTAWLLLIAHALYKALLFLAAGIGSHRRHTERLDELSGSLTPFELWGTLGIGLLGVAGLPPTGGFVAKEQLFAAAAHPGYGWASLAGWAMAGAGGAYAARVWTGFRPRGASPPPAAPLGMFAPVAALAPLVIATALWHPWALAPLAPTREATTAITLGVVIAGAVLGFVWTRPFDVLAGTAWAWLWRRRQAAILGGTGLDRGADGLVRWLVAVVTRATRIIRVSATGQAQWYLIVSAVLLMLFWSWNIR